MRLSCRIMLGIVVRWTMIACIGFLGGVLLELIHNSLLCRINSGEVLMSGYSRFVVDAFRAESGLRLIAGWGSCLSSLFSFLNLGIGAVLCVTMVMAKNTIMARKTCLWILDYCLLCNLIVFFFLAAALLAPLLPVRGIMGAHENEIVPGASSIGNFLCGIEKVFFMSLPTVFITCVLLRLKKRKRTIKSSLSRKGG